MWSVARITLGLDSISADVWPMEIPQPLAAVASSHHWSCFVSPAGIVGIII